MKARNHYGVKFIWIIELTVPWEKNMEDRHEDKHNKYVPLLNLLGKQHGCLTALWPVEIGARGRPHHSLMCLDRLLTKKGAARTRKGMATAAIKASSVIFSQRESVSFAPQAEIAVRGDGE